MAERDELVGTLFDATEGSVPHHMVEAWADAILAAGWRRSALTDIAARIEVYRKALMVAHHHDWSMDTISEAAHICAKAGVGSALTEADITWLRNQVIISGIHGEPGVPAGLLERLAQTFSRIAVPDATAPSEEQS